MGLGNNILKDLFKSLLQNFFGIAPKIVLMKENFNM